MKLLRYLYILIILSTPAVAFATPTQYGESGLISVPTSEITGVGLFQVAAWINSSQNNGDKFTLLPISLSMGFSDGMEIFASYPNVLLNADNSGSGRGYENLGVKFRLSGRGDSKFRSSVDAFLRQAVSGDTSLNGLKDSGARLIMSYQLVRNTNIHLNVGYLKVSSPTGLDYKDETLFGGAIEFSGSDRVRPFVEVDGNTRRDGGSPRIEVSPGMQYYLLPSLSLMIGGGYGATDVGPDYRVVAGLIFASGTGRYVKAIPVIPGSRERFAETTVTPEELMPEIPSVSQEGAPGSEVGTLPGSPTIAEGLGTSQLQPPSAITSTDITKLTGKDIMTPGTLTTSPGMAPQLIEPPMPVLKTMSPEKAATGIGKASLRPEIPAELPSVAFAPPMPVGKGIGKSAVTPEPSAGLSKPEAAEGITPEIKKAKAGASIPAAPAGAVTPLTTTELPSVAFAPPMPSGGTKGGVETPKMETLVEQSPAGQPVGVTTEEPTAAAGIRVKKRVETTPGKHKIVLQSDIMFAFNNYEIAHSGKKILNKLSEEIKNDKGTILEVKLEGHTDNVGTAAYNKRLSLKRAKSVKTYLTKRGIKSKIISVKGFGYERPVASNETPEGREKNRRVDTTIEYMQVK